MRGAINLKHSCNLLSDTEAVPKIRNIIRKWIINAIWTGLQGEKAQKDHHTLKRKREVIKAVLKVLAWKEWLKESAKEWKHMSGWMNEMRGKKLTSDKVSGLHSLYFRILVFSSWEFACGLCVVSHSTGSVLYGSSHS